MRCSVLFYTFCLYFRVIELSPTKIPLKVRRIIGGEDADEDKYAYIVRLQNRMLILERVTQTLFITFLHTCTAAVIKPTWTLTAAHCIEEDLTTEPNRKVKNLGITSDFKSKLERTIMYGPLNNTSISKVIYYVIHPGYQLRMLDMKNDIALIRNYPISLKQYARISSLDYLSMIGQEVTLAGYGKTNDTINSVPVVNDATALRKPLQFLEALIVPCDRTTVSIKGGMCLARRCAKLAGVCPGDSGGPLLHSSGVVGVNSVGTLQLKTFCNLQPYTPFYDPAGITPTSPYIDWISSTIVNGVHRDKETVFDDTESLPFIYV